MGGRIDDQSGQSADPPAVLGKDRYATQLRIAVSHIESRLFYPSETCVIGSSRLSVSHCCRMVSRFMVSQ